MDVRVQLELIGEASAIQHEVRPQEHEVGELVTLARIASFRTLIGHSTESRSWMQYLHLALRAVLSVDLRLREIHKELL